MMAVAHGVTYQVNVARATGFVESLSIARTSDVPGIVESLEAYRPIANPLLLRIVDSPDASPTSRLHAAMALLAVEQQQDQLVYAGLLKATPDQLRTICHVLAKWGRRNELLAQMWRLLLDTHEDPSRRLRAAAGIANIDPSTTMRDEENWREASVFVGRQLVAEVGTNFSRFDDWVSALHSLGSIVSPELDRIFSNDDAAELDRYVSAMVLAEWDANDPLRLVDLAVRASEKEYALFVPKLKAQREAAQRRLIDEFQRSVPEGTTREGRFRIEKRRAHAAVALLEFGHFEPMQALLEGAGDDPTAGSYVEDRISKLDSHADVLLRMMSTASVAFRASLLRSLAGMSIDRISLESREAAIETVAKIYATDGDAAVHAAAEWALRRWQQVDRLERAQATVPHSPIMDQNWYCNKHGFTMVIFQGPIDVVVGSPPGEWIRDPSDEAQVSKRIDRTFEVSSTEVTVKQFGEFFPNFPHLDRTYAPSANCPMSTVPWHFAAEFCNKLSALDGIPPEQFCYLKQGDDLIAFPDYLHRTGYRLLTEAEWEYACRAGALTAFSFGDDPSLADRYAYSIRNSGGHSWPVGSLCPNRFGLFDMHGNVAEWMHDDFVADRTSGEDWEGPINPDEEALKAIRSFGYPDFVSQQRSANRNSANARRGNSFRNGFRIARTITTLQIHR